MLKTLEQPLLTPNPTPSSLPALETSKTIKQPTIEELKDRLNYDIVNKVLSGHSDRINCLAFSKDGRYLATGSFDKTAKVWNVEEGTLEKNTLGPFWFYKLFSIQQRWKISSYGIMG